MNTIELAAQIKKAIEAKSLNSIPANTFTSEALLFTWPECGYNGLHLAAQYGQLGIISREWLIATNLIKHTQDTHEDNVFTVAARHGALRLLPKTLLDCDLIFCQNGRGETILHTAFRGRYGSLEYIPSELQVARYLRLDDQSGRTPLHDAAKFGYLTQILEKGLVSLDDLLEESEELNEVHSSPLREVMICGRIDQVHLPSEWIANYRNIREHLRPTLAQLEKFEDEKGISARQKATRWLIDLAEAQIAQSSE